MSQRGFVQSLSIQLSAQKVFTEHLLCARPVQGGWGQVETGAWSSLGEGDTGTAQAGMVGKLLPEVAFSLCCFMKRQVSLLLCLSKTCKRALVRSATFSSYPHPVSNCRPPT